MKALRTISILILIALFASSCNIDSSEGLFEMAADSQEKEDFSIYSVLSMPDSEGYSYISTSDGIVRYNPVTRSYDPSFPSTGDGNSSRRVAEFGNSGEIWCDRGDGSYYNLADGTPAPASFHLSGRTLVRYYDKDTVVTLDKEHSCYYIGDTPLPHASAVTVIGSKALRIVREDGSTEYWIDGTTVTGIDGLCILSYNGVFITRDAVFQIEGGSVKNKEKVSGSGWNAAAYTMDGRTYFTFQGSTTLYLYNPSSTSSKLLAYTIPGLSNLEILAFVGGTNTDSEKKLVAITADSGARVIDIEKKSIY